jgi:ribA/ribD-fused uncharacterized protein
MFFNNDYEFLSNFFVEKDGSTAEHKYQAAKAIEIEDYDRILAAETPGKAKRMGRGIPCREDWNTARLGVMLGILMTKFEDPELRAKLTATGRMPLTEHNNWHDCFWGACVCEDCAAQGKNMLGQLLMIVRDFYRMEKK